MATQITIRAKLLGTVLGLSGLIAVAISTSFFIFQSSEAETVLRDRAATVSSMLASAVKAGLEFEDVDAVSATFAAVHQNTEIIFIEVLGTDGNVFASYLAEAFAARGKDIGAFRNLNSTLIQEEEVISDFDSRKLGIVRVGVSKQSVADVRNRTLKISLIAGLVIALIGSLTAILLSRSITQPLQSLLEAMRKLADGDFTTTATVRTSDEIGELGQGVNRMINSVRDVISRIVATGELLQQTSEELGNSSNQLAGAADSQSRITTEAAASVEELAGSAQSVYDYARKTTDKSKDATSSAGQGRESVKPTLQAMTSTRATMERASEIIEGLHNKSQSIAQITDLIKEIAAQTNLLSLNAGIEAARAGEHGRGFEVVAEEVRKLAHNSSESSGQIGEILEALQKDAYDAVEIMQAARAEMEQSVERLTETSAAFEQISGAVNDATTLSGELLSVSEEQARSSDEASSRLERILAETRGVATQSQELASTVEQLKKLSHDLHSMTSNFRV